MHGVLPTEGAACQKVYQQVRYVLCICFISKRIRYVSRYIRRYRNLYKSKLHLLHFMQRRYQPLPKKI